MVDEIGEGWSKSEENGKKLKNWSFLVMYG